MKQWMIKLVALFAMVAVAVSFSGCGISSGVMEACLTNTAQASSMTYEVETVMGMSVMGQPVSVKLSGEGSYTCDPVRVAMVLSQDTSGMEMETYTELIGDQYIQYLKIGEQWVKQALPSASMTQDPKLAMEIYLEGISRYQKEGEEMVAGKTASKYSAVIEGEALEKVIQASGALDQLEQSGLDASQAGELYSDLSDLYITLWVDETAMQPVKIEMNLTEMMQSIMDKLGQMDDSAVDMDITAFSLALTITDYNNVDEIIIPEEALSASELEAAV